MREKFSLIRKWLKKIYKTLSSFTLQRHWHDVLHGDSTIGFEMQNVEVDGVCKKKTRVFNGTPLSSGQTVTAYRNSIAYTPETCEAQIRTSRKYVIIQVRNEGFTPPMETKCFDAANMAFQR